MNNDPIYVREGDIPLTKYRKQLILKFLENTGYNTYTDKNYNNLQCHAGTFRSVTEMHQIVLSRFPKTSFNAILRIIKELIDENGRVVMVYCTQINKVVLKYIQNSEAQYISSYSRKNFYKTKGVDGYSLEDYEQIINDIK